MWESQVSGCQLAQWKSVKAQTNPLSERPWATAGFLTTYSPSSKLTNCCRTVWPKTAMVMAARATHSPATRQRNAAWGVLPVFEMRRFIAGAFVF